MKQEQMKKFLESKGIKVGKVEGDDFSSVFHISDEDRANIEKNKSDYEKETGLLIETSDSFGMSVVVMENAQEE